VTTRLSSPCRPKTERSHDFSKTVYKRPATPIARAARPPAGAKILAAAEELEAFAEALVDVEPVVAVPEVVTAVAVPDTGPECEAVEEVLAVAAERDDA